MTFAHPELETRSKIWEKESKRQNNDRVFLESHTARTVKQDLAVVSIG